MPSLDLLRLSTSAAAAIVTLSAIAAPVLSPVSPAPATLSRAVVIHDAGGIPIGDLVETVVQEPGKRAVLPPPPLPISDTGLRIFPVRTTSIGPALLSPEQRANARTPTAPGMPLCIIGDDELSRIWLRTNLPMLRKNRIACLVASVASEEALKALQIEVPDVRLVAANVNGLAITARIPAWPVLISPDGRILQ